MRARVRKRGELRLEALSYRMRRRGRGRKPAVVCVRERENGGDRGELRLEILREESSLKGLGFKSLKV